MIVTNSDRTLPAEWTDLLCAELYFHARELGLNGNPGGYVLTAELHPFVGWKTTNGERILKGRDAWDYDGIRAWIAANPSDVRLAWQREIVEPW